MIAAIYARKSTEGRIRLMSDADDREVPRKLKDDSVRAIVYRGAGTDAFAPGADISEFQESRKVPTA